MTFAVCVTFEVDQAHVAAFMPLMYDNAATSLKVEAGCQRFDVLIDSSRPGDIFLYELYDDEAAFAAHLQTAHFQAFDGAVTDMIITKSIRTYTQVTS